MIRFCRTSKYGYSLEYDKEGAIILCSAFNEAYTTPRNAVTVSATLSDSPGELEIRCEETEDIHLHGKRGRITIEPEALELGIERLSAFIERGEVTVAEFNNFPGKSQRRESTLHMIPVA